jgi:hypothetical protein
MIDDPSPRTLTRWPAKRVARLGFLVGQGNDAARVARDPLIASTTGNVHRQARRFGLAFRDATPAIRLPPQVARRCDAAAAKRSLTREELCRLLLIAAGSDDGLIDNILDDGE